MIAAVPTSVVTGGAGFLGSHLCDALLVQGHRVICVDNLETGSLANVEHIRDEQFEFVNRDVTEHITIAEPIDFVYHLAALASPNVSPAKSVRAHTASPIASGATVGANAGPPTAAMIPVHVDTSGKNAGEAVGASRRVINSPPGKRMYGP